MQRIAKLIAASGLCSRREAERWIAEGRVRVDGQVVTEPGMQAEAAQIRVDGKKLPKVETARLWCFHKPKGVMTTRSDPQGRPTYVDLLPEELKQLHPVGRLDFNSEGLLLLTNDGALKRSLELPSNGWERVYRVRFRGTMSKATIAALAKGVTVEEVKYKPIKVQLDKDKTKSNSWVEVTLTEGKNREIRKVFAHFGHPVSRLIRIAYGPYRLGNLKAGDIEETVIL
jgi:23S rRNA pseudouridine2605 synthase